MKLQIYQVDAFANKLFEGNPAAVVPLDEWLPDDIMQKIGLENNLSETAFIVKQDDNYHIRWFTPSIEVPLCGHATLASSFVIFSFLEPSLNDIHFQSRSGELIVNKNGDLITLNFPANKPSLIDAPQKLLDAMPVKPSEVLFNKSFLAIFESEEDVRTMKPDIRKLAQLHEDGLIISAKGKDYDFVSRFFVPGAGIDEDPVTGYAHTILIPYWADKLGKKELKAYQASERGGELFVGDLGNNRVKIAGRAVLYLQGEITI